MRGRRIELYLFCAAVGLALGVGIFTFVYAKGFSYLTNDPTACGNCHIMDEHLSGWMKSSHKAVAVCNDCHTPSGVVPKYLTKASNGFWHSVAFTTGNFPDPIRIKAHNREITESACMKCHDRLTASITPGAHLAGTGTAPHAGDDKISCVRCHASVGHWVR